MMQYWYTFRQKTLPNFIAIALKAVINLTMKTCRLNVSNLEHYINAAKNDKCIVMLWHNRLILAPVILSRFGPDFMYGVLVSQSRDGQIISSIINSYDIGYSIRVAHNAKKDALDEAIAFVNAKKGILVVTPDGPRGPRYRLKKGTAYIAKSTGAKVVPMSWTPNKFWQLKSWDKLIIPKPFSTIQVAFGEPVSLLQEQKLPSSIEVKSIEAKICLVDKETSIGLSKPLR